MKYRLDYTSNSVIGTSLKNLDAGIVSINGGPFVNNGNGLDIKGIMKLKYYPAIGANDSNKKMGFKNGMLVETNYTTNSQSEEFRYDWFRSYNDFVLLKDGLKLLENENLAGYSNTEAHTAIGQKENGNYLFVCSAPGLTLKNLAEFMKSKDCNIAFNLGGGESSGMVVKKAYKVKNSIFEKDITDALVIVKKASVLNKKLKIKVKNVPLIAKRTVYTENGYLATTHTFPVKSIVEVDYLYARTIENYIGSLTFEGDEYYFDYDFDNMLPFGDLISEYYFVKNDCGTINAKNSLDLEESIFIPINSRIEVINIEITNEDENKVLIKGTYNGNFIEFYFQKLPMYLANYFVESGGW